MNEEPSLIFDLEIAQVNAGGGGGYSLTWAIQWVCACAAPRKGMVLAL